MDMENRNRELQQEVIDEYKKVAFMSLTSEVKYLKMLLNNAVHLLEEGSNMMEITTASFERRKKALINESKEVLDTSS